MAIRLGQHHNKENCLYEKILFLLFTPVLIFIFAGCQSKEGQEGARAMGMVLETGIYDDKNWSEQVGTYQNDAIPNKETAINVAMQIFSGMKKSSETEKFKPQSVFYDEKDEIWIVSFWKDADEVIFGGGCSIAMQKKDGKVLRIWFGE